MPVEIQCPASSLDAQAVGKAAEERLGQYLRSHWTMATLPTRPKDRRQRAEAAATRPFRQASPRSVVGTPLLAVPRGILPSTYCTARCGRSRSRRPGRRYRISGTESGAFSCDSDLDSRLRRDRNKVGLRSSLPDSTTEILGAAQRRRSPRAGRFEIIDRGSHPTQAVRPR